MSTIERRLRVCVPFYVERRLTLCVHIETGFYPVTELIVIVSAEEPYIKDRYSIGARHTLV